MHFISAPDLKENDVIRDDPSLQTGTIIVKDASFSWNSDDVEEHHRLCEIASDPKKKK